MNKDQIKALISAKIAGQGNQVDSGGALDAILNAIVDAIPEGGGGVSPIQLPEETGLASLTQEQYDQIRENLIAGCNVVMVGDSSPVTIFSSLLGELAYFSNYDEPIAVQLIEEPGE